MNTNNKKWQFLIIFIAVVVIIIIGGTTDVLSKEPGELLLEITGKRSVFVRMEKNARIQAKITNNVGFMLFKGNTIISMGGIELKGRYFSRLAPKKSYTIDIPVDTSLRPGQYNLNITFKAVGSKQKYQAEKSIPIVIVPRHLPYRMSVILWAEGDLSRPVEVVNFDRAKEIGFTHHLWHPVVNSNGRVDYRKIWDAKGSVKLEKFEKGAEVLNKALADDFGMVAYIYPGRFIGLDKEKKRFSRVKPDGKPYGGRQNICGRFKQVPDYCYNAGESVARTYGDFPALEAALIHSEVRDHINLCFHNHDRTDFRSFAGYDIPKEAISKKGVIYSRVPSFPANHIIADDNPILTFYKWFWQTGDGWNLLHTLTHKGLKSACRKDFWTFFDPAVRVPSISGSGGGVDFISQWTYTYPDPIKIGVATDELFAMAGSAARKQGVMKMTQLIWGRSETAPKRKDSDPSKVAEWEKREPDAQWITIAPDNLREAFWCKLSRPIKGIMYHGWGSLVDGKKGGYRYTNPQTRRVLKQLIEDVVRPLGPTLLQIPDRKSDVAFLESFSSQMFARRGSWGDSGKWQSDAYLILRYAQLQPRIIYDETILKEGLNDFRVLVLVDCDVLTKNVVRKIREFQNRGGIIISDENLVPDIAPDIFLESYKRTNQADKDKTELQIKAGLLRRELDVFYERYGDSSNPDVIVRFRQYRTADYLFAVNDRRTFGDYVGQYGLVMEKGLPADARVSVKRTKGFVYNLLEHCNVKTVIDDGSMYWPVRLGPGAGGLFMITGQKIDAIHIKAPKRIRTGDKAKIRIDVVDKKRQRINAVVPLHVNILNSQNQPVEFSGFYGAKDGRLTIDLDIACNDILGMWKIQVKDLASGLTVEDTFKVKRR